MIVAKGGRGRFLASDNGDHVVRAMIDDSARRRCEFNRAPSDDLPPFPAIKALSRCVICRKTVDASQLFPRQIIFTAFKKIKLPRVNGRKVKKKMGGRQMRRRYEEKNVDAVTSTFTHNYY